MFIPLCHCWDAYCSSSWSRWRSMSQWGLHPLRQVSPLGLISNQGNSVNAQSPGIHIVNSVRPVHWSPQNPSTLSPSSLDKSNPLPKVNPHPCLTLAEQMFHSHSVYSWLVSRTTHSEHKELAEHPQSNGEVTFDSLSLPPHQQKPLSNESRTSSTQQ